jgi:hypothetical protein
MFLFFPAFSEPARRKAEVARRPGSHVPRRARAGLNHAAPPADLETRLRQAAKKAFRLMGED